jgi:hypothetical protein
MDVSNTTDTTRTGRIGMGPSPTTLAVARAKRGGRDGEANLLDSYASDRCAPPLCLCPLARQSRRKVAVMAQGSEHSRDWARAWCVQARGCLQDQPAKVSDSMGMTRIVTSTYRYKRPPRKQQAMPLTGSAVVTMRAAEPKVGLTPSAC